MPIDRIGTDGIENGAVVPADLSTGGPNWDSSGNLSFNSGYGSTAVAYGCRAWVNFNGTGTVAIRASGNVSSITDNGTGDYTVNFATLMLDANYESNAGAGTPGVANGIGISPAQVAQTASALRMATVAVGTTPALTDYTYVNVAVFR